MLFRLDSPIWEEDLQNCHLGQIPIWKREGEKRKSIDHTAECNKVSHFPPRAMLSDNF